MNLQRVAAAVPFAQLLGLSKRAEDDDEARRARRAEEDDGDDKDKQSRRAEDDSDEDEGRKVKRAKSEDSDDDEAEDGEDGKDDDGEEEGDDDGDEEGKKSRKAKSKSKSKRAEDKDDEEDNADEGDDEGRKAKSARSAVRRERARCAAIIAHGVAIGSVRQACVLAFDTSMGVKAAKASLSACKADGSSPRGGLADRMAAAAVPTVGADSGLSSAPGITKTAAAIIAIGEKVRGETARK